MRRALLLLLALMAAACATLPSAPTAPVETLSPREREALIMREMERAKRQEEGTVRRLADEAKKKGKEFLSSQETDARRRSIEIYRTLINQYPDTRNTFMAEASFRLAELLFEDERERIRGIMDREGAGADVQPDFSRAIDAYRKVTEGFPSHPLAEDAYYGLAYCFTEQGEPDLAADGYTRLIETYPRTRYAAEIHMRLGEYFFNLGNIPPAIEHYQAAIAVGNRDYSEKALYKLGWCYYNQDNYDQAVESFLQVLDLNAGERISVGTLVNESLDIIARAYSESGGTPALFKRIQRRQQDHFAPALLLRLADIYKDRSLYPEAVGTYRLYLQNYPAGGELPRVLANLRECYSLRGDSLSALEQVEGMPRHLGPGSPWHEAASPEERAKARETMREALEEAADQRRARAQTGGSRTELTRALADLDAAALLSDGPPPCRVRYVRGLLLSELGETERGARAWMELATAPDCGDWAGRASLEAVDLLLKSAQAGTVSLPLLGEAVGLASRIAPADARVPRAVLALGQVAANSGSVAGARAQYSILLRQHQGSPEADKARSLMARSFFQAGDYPQASSWFREAWKKSADRQAAEEARGLLAYSLFKEAEIRNQGGDGKGAAELFESLSREFPDSDVAQIALFNAGKLYRDAGLTRKATELFERLATTYTESGYATEALETSVRILEALGDPLRAASDSLLLANRSTGEARAAALAKAADLFAAANAPARSASYRTQLLKEFPAPPERAARQTHLLGRDWQAAGDWKKAQPAYAKAVAMGKAKDAPEDVLRWSAQSQLKLAEEALGRYNALTITPPLDKSIEAKRALLTETVAGLVAAGGYKIAEVATAANFQIGHALEGFKDAIMTSPRPEGLSPLEMEEYESQLTEMAFPFEEKARKAYLVNIERAVSLSLLDPWIVRSYERMAELAPWAYLREERIVYPHFTVPAPQAPFPSLPDLDSVRRSQAPPPPPPPPAPSAPPAAPAPSVEPAPAPPGAVEPPPAAAAPEAQPAAAAATAPLETQP